VTPMPPFSNRRPLPTSLPANAQPPRPKPFDMTEPVFERGVWTFWLTAEARVLDYVMHLYCILQQPLAPSPFFVRRPQNRMLFSINPRYDHQEAWLWIHETLECESKDVELADIWNEILEDISSKEIEDQDNQQ
jgi:hypothetical protein